MCGIIGGWTLQNFQQFSSRMPYMISALRHRGPDAEEQWLDPNNGVALGHRRLAIVGLGKEGNQPMHSESGRYCLTYNGEIYNHIDLRKTLSVLGKTIWRGQSDTETLLACFEYYGIEETVKLCSGMFAMAIWDSKSHELILVRDRLGEKPLYYGYIEGTFVFGSELRAITAGSAHKPNYDTDAFALFLRYGYIPQPYSAYQGLYKLPAGNHLHLTRQMLHQKQLPAVTTYWKPEDYLPRDNSQHIDPLEAVSQLEALLEQSVKEQMLSEVPLGAFLSGGIDSSTIVALMQKHSMKPIKTFTVGFGDPRFNEASHAKEVATHLGTEHTELYIDDQDALAVVPKLTDIYDEPFGDSSQIPTYLVSKLARSKVTVSLSGDGGDELFLGYGRYTALVKYWRLLGSQPKPMRKLVASCLSCIPMKYWDCFFKLAGPILRQTRYAQVNGWRLHRLASTLSVDSPMACYLVMMCQWDPSTPLIKSTQPLPHELDLPFNLKAGSLMKQAGLRDIKSYLPDDILVKVDRAAMANSLETRVPLLDHRITEFALSIPQGIHFKDSQSKWLIRQVLYKHVPRDMIERPKMGFGVPLADWLRGPLRDWAETLLSSQSLTSIGILEPKPIRALWQRHLNRDADGHYPLWNVLMLIEWINAQRCAPEFEAK